MCFLAEGRYAADNFQVCHYHSATLEKAISNLRLTQRTTLAPLDAFHGGPTQTSPVEFNIQPRWLGRRVLFEKDKSTNWADYSMQPCWGGVFMARQQPINTVAAACSPYSSCWQHWWHSILLVSAYSSGVVCRGAPVPLLKTSKQDSGVPNQRWCRKLMCSCSSPTELLPPGGYIHTEARLSGFYQTTAV